MKLQILAAVLLASTSAFAGDNGGGTLNCISGSGRTKVYGMAGVDYNGIGPAALTFEIDGAAIALSAAFPVSDNSVLVDFVSYRHKVSYDAVIKRAFIHTSEDGSRHTISESVLKLEMVKGSMKSKGGDRYEFLANIPANSSVDPRTSPDLKNINLYDKRLDKDVQVKCVVDVSI